MTIPSQGLTNATSSYRYDSDYQLTQANYPSVAPYNGEVDGWTYDAIGNRLTNTVNGSPQTYTYFKNGSNPLNGQRLSSDGVNAYTYDANGNTITRNGTPGNFTFGWDSNDRMISISGATAASYTYDYRGRRTSTSVGGSTTTYLYQGLNLIQAAGSSSTLMYLFGPGSDEPLAVARGGSVSYVSVDTLGSVVLLADAAASIENTYLYDAWGVALKQSTTRANLFGYTGREFAEGSLLYYRARYYAPLLARFLQEDPARLGAMRQYAYALNRPTTFVDPLGLQAGAGGQFASGPWGQRPAPCTCDLAKVRARAERMATFLSGMEGGSPPSATGGEEGAYTPTYTICIGGFCAFPQPQPWPFRPWINPNLTDPCLLYCVRAHEWTHYTDPRAYDMDDPNLETFLEKPAYAKELACLKSFLGAS